MIDGWVGVLECIGCRVPGFWCIGGRVLCMGQQAGCRGVQAHLRCYSLLSLLLDRGEDRRPAGRCVCHVRVPLN